jgi:hypothetical protein
MVYLEAKEKKPQDGSIQSLYVNPSIADEYIAPKWAKLLASALTVGEHDDTMSIADAIGLCSVLLAGDFGVSGPPEWEDLPRPLRSWLQIQDGLNIGGSPVQSLDDLPKVHGIIFKRPAIRQEHCQVNILTIFIDIVERYFALITITARDTSIGHLITRGTEPMHLKRSACKSRLLDDPFPRFKRSDTERYIAYYLKRGCGQLTCEESRQFSYAIPWDDQVKWSPSKSSLLVRSPMKAEWTDILLRKPPSTDGLPISMSIIRRSCMDEASVQQDGEPRWTIETPPRYVIRKPYCQVCRKNSVTWCPTESSIRWIDATALTKMWKKRTDKNWTIDDIWHDPSSYFPKTREEQAETSRRRTKCTIRYPG